ncbi:hypothetical protein CPC08DRAFT_485761 [Agrocybe pediades]|nr:hypothetical protein CPC08DRAFT_485761 [Agrocybe pediades]
MHLPVRNPLPLQKPFLSHSLRVLPTFSISSSSLVSSWAHLSGWAACDTLVDACGEATHSTARSPAMTCQNAWLDHEALKSFALSTYWIN